MSKSHLHPGTGRVLVTFAQAALALGACLLAGCGKQNRELKIGFLTEQTGAESYIAASSTPALEEEINRVNATGGINGYTFKLVAYDTRSEVPVALAAARRMIDQDKVTAILGPSWSAAAIPLAQVADTAKVPMITTTASNLNVTVDEAGRLHPYVFRVCFIDNYQGQALAEYAFRKLKARKVAFLTDLASPYSVGVHRFFEERFRQLGGRVILNESYQQGDTEFRPQLGRIQAARPDLLVAAAYTYKDAGLIVQQMGAVGLRTPVMGADGWFVEDLLSMAGPGLEGAICATGADTNAPEFQGFNQEFEARNRGTKATIYTYYGLDALMLLEHAVRTATAGGGTPDPPALRAALENATGVQLFTSRVTMEKDTHNPHDKPILLEQVRRGRWALLETFDPAAR